MAGNPSIIIPKMEVTIRGTDVLVDELSVRLMVNDLATLSLSAHLKDDATANTQAVAKPISAVLKETANLQRYVFNESPAEVDSRVVISSTTDGEEGVSLVFDGIVAGGGYALSGNAINRTYNLVHRAALLGLWDGSIYSYGFIDTYLDQLDAVAGSVADKIEAVINKLLHPRDLTVEEAWADAGVANPDVIARLSQTHTVNTKVLPAILRCLQDSRALTEQPLLDGNIDENHKLNLLRYIKDALVNSVSFLTSTLEYLRPGFGLQFVCNTWDDGGVGVLANLDVTTAAAIPLRVSQAQVSAVVGGRKDVPLRGVTVEYVVPAGYLVLPTDYDVALPIVAGRYPANFGTGGRVLHIDPPPWIQPDVNYPPVLSNPEQADLGALQDAFARYKKDIKTKLNPFTDLLNDWARQRYQYLALLNSRVNVAIPLDLSIRPGRVIELIDRVSGVSLLTGYVAEVEHRIVSRPSAPSAGTTLQLTHVQAAGFTLVNS